MMGVLRKETILRKKMSVGGYGGFSDAMRCHVMMLCCWLVVGLIEEELVVEELRGAGREGTVS